MVASIQKFYWTWKMFINNKRRSCIYHITHLNEQKKVFTTCTSSCIKANDLWVTRVMVHTMYRLWLMWLINCASNVPLNGTKKCFPIDVYHCFLVGFLFFSHLFFNGKKINWCINTFWSKYFPLQWYDRTYPYCIYLLRIASFSVSWLEIYVIFAAMSLEIP